MTNPNFHQQASSDLDNSLSAERGHAHTNASAQTAVPRRFLAPDIARGMMLLFIALANVSYFLWDQPAGQTSAHPTEGTPLDQALQVLMMIAVDQRAVPMFAFLFGYGIVQFMNSRLDRGFPESRIRRMLLRRHWWLLVFGLIHAGLLFYGDVLGTYALTALVLMALLFYRRNITLWIWSSIGIGLIGVFALLSLISGLLALSSPEQGSPPDSFSITDARETAMGETNYLVSIVARLGAWAMLTPLQIFGLVVPVCIILGWLAARRRLLENPAAHRKTLIRIAVIGIPVGWLGGIPYALTHTGALGLSSDAGIMFFGLAQFTGIFCGIGYAAIFGLLALRWEGEQKTPALLHALSAVGQRSLTFYLWQAFIFAPLMAAWGLGFGAHIGTAEALGIALLVWLAGVGMAAWLEGSHRRGPAELLLRRLTYGKDDQLQHHIAT